MNYGIVIPNWRAGENICVIADLAVRAEAAGWDGVLLADHLVSPPSAISGVRRPLSFPDPFVLFAAIAARTTKIRLITWVTPVPRRQPWQLARDAATLDRLSRGRLTLGVGLGAEEDFTSFGGTWNPAERAAQTDEALMLMARFWTGQPVSHSGTFYSVSDAVLLPTPCQRPRIPIVAGGMWPNKGFLRRGARWDGIVPAYPGDGDRPGEGARPGPEFYTRELLGEYMKYRGAHQGAGEVFLPLTPSGRSEGYAELCGSLGATWLYANDVRLPLEQLRSVIDEGPGGAAR